MAMAGSGTRSSIAPDKRYQHLAVAKHLATLPPDAPVRAIYESATVQEILGEFEIKDAAAGKAQERFKSMGRWMLTASTAGAVVGAILLLPQWLVTWLPAGLIGGVQTAALLIAMIAAWWIAASKRVEAWMETRGQAEELRGKLFRAFLEAPVPAGAGPAPTTSQKLDLIHAAYIEDQLAFFDKRSVAHERDAGRRTPLRLIGYALFAIVAVLAVPLAGRFLQLIGFSIWPWLDTLTTWLVTHDADRWRLAAATTASSLLAHSSAKSSLDQNARTAGLYRATAARVRARMDARRKPAEAAATLGDLGAVQQYLADIQRVLEAEHFAWFTSPPEMRPIPRPDAGSA